MPHILLIESDKVLATNLKDYLKRRGYSLDWQVNAQDAVHGADSKTPDVVIMDLLLAQRNGVEFLYEFRTYPDWLVIPIIILSSLPLDDIKDSLASLEHLNIEAFHYKPSTSLSTLTYALEQALAKTPA